MIPKPYTYLAIDLLCIIIPLVASFHPKSQFYKDWKYYFPANVIIGTFFIAWDVLYTDMRIWWFDTSYTTGIQVFNLPLEELLFFVCVPYACTYTYYVLSSYFKFAFYKTARIISYVLVLGLITVAFFNPERLYTSVTFILLSIFLMVTIRKNVSYGPTFFVTYLIILLPFFISNGILTGSFIATPIVNYNNYHNLGMRMFTIPVEDAFYGMLLLYSNIALYEWFKQKSIKQSS